MFDTGIMEPIEAEAPPDATTTVVATGSDLIEAVRQSSMLAEVVIGVWSGERTDAAAMNRLKAETGARGNVGRVVKNQLAGADGLLKDVVSAYNKIRSIHYQYTLPWVTDPHALRMTGPRLLPTALWDKYVTEIATARREGEALLDKFCQEYPALVARARENLGELADATYPTVDEIRSKFRAVVDWQPVPDGASFKGLPGSTLDRLSRVLSEKQERTARAAQRLMWEQVREELSHLRDRLADPEARFRVGTIENVRKLTELLPGWAVLDPERAQEIAADISAMLTGVSADAVRDNVALRERVAEQAGAVCGKLDAWGL